MANVYSLNNINNDFDKNDTNYQLASVSYVYFLIKKLADILEEYINKDKPIGAFREKININHLESTEIIDIPIAEQIVNVKASELDTDSMHKFISESELNVLKDKPTYVDVQSIIAELREELHKAIDKSYINLINIPDAVNKFKDLSNILKNDDIVNNIVSLISEKVSLEEFDDHKKSIFHLNSNDRKALNLLIGFIEKGCADWNAAKDQPNYIRNKPKKLPADGGNSYTVGGYTANTLMNHQVEDVIYGLSGQRYNKNTVNELLNKDNYHDNIINNISNSNIGKYYTFKSGKYLFETIKLSNKTISGDIIISGVSNRNTIFSSTNTIVNGNFIIKNLLISDSNILIIENCTFDNVRFVNCKISFDASNEITVKNCIFNNCTISFRGYCIHNMITNNRFINTTLPQYIGGGNIINNNMIY